MQTPKKIMKNFLSILLDDFGFNGLPDFTRSVFHVKLLIISIPVSVISAQIQMIFGLKGLTILAFTLLLGIELFTGIASALSKGDKISSRKFGRFIFKLCIWLTCFFITNTFAKEFDDGSIANMMFTWLHSSLVTYITIEYLLSVIENMGKLSGKSTTPIIKKIRKKLEKYLHLD
ncbi:unnamed protein product [marine sediment metagenome]|uniref:Holin n=1 Tax=marine sediment metagenome TaxID=412755 RepID=X0TFY1_9ZZZZ